MGIASLMERREEESIGSSNAKEESLVFAEAVETGEIGIGCVKLLCVDVLNRIFIRF
ncbi:jg24369, partial [Pararge aegeria aegeria]